MFIANGINPLNSTTNFIKIEGSFGDVAGERYYISLEHPLLTYLNGDLSFETDNLATQDGAFQSVAYGVWTYDGEDYATFGEVIEASGINVYDVSLFGYSDWRAIGLVQGDGDTLEDVIEEAQSVFTDEAQPTGEQPTMQNNICGCMDSNALNYNPDATIDGLECGEEAVCLYDDVQSLITPMNIAIVGGIALALYFGFRK